MLHSARDRLTQWSARLRFEYARRRWARWAMVGALVLIIARVLVSEADAMRAERDRWGARTTVVVATAAHSPGDTIRSHTRSFPLAVVPHGAVDTVPAGGRTVRHLVEGEIIVAGDLGGGEGRAAGADDGQAVIAIPVEGPAPSTGTRVTVVAEGIVLAASGTVLSTVDDIAFVAVDEERAAVVAHAVTQRVASLVYLP